MERILIAVEPDEGGWRIQLAGIVIARNLDKVVAIDKAADLARERHAATGTPTGVHVRMTCGDGVMVGLNG
ncbi:hypothetical protein QFW77_15260 [Luteimonas sp. RD2P54]|uniref:DUF2188 domain-containing protein n=1 Tax=Luteimonas endophytica TaxID=3042023 RepID=A0ABT6JDP8_9GAMM|nr:hypothetical protein [Luteimonas endophytica]MDH5824333.1 hypothetical protein [Luteimonas endophytica]